MEMGSGVGPGGVGPNGDELGATLQRLQRLNNGVRGSQNAVLKSQQ